MLPHSATGQNRKTAWTNQAAHLNAVKDVANAHMSGQLGRAPKPSAPMRLPDLIQIKNISGSDLGFGAILQLKDYALDPSMDYLQNHVWFEADVPDDPDGDFVTLWQPIKDGAIGWACVHQALVAAQYDSEDGEPMAKEKWGVKPGETVLRKDYPGFKIHSVVDYGSEKIVWAIRLPIVEEERITFRNDDSTEFPQYGIAQVVSIDYSDDREVYVVKRPAGPPHTSDLAPILFVWNANGAVAAEEEGKGLVVSRAKHKVLTLKWEGDLAPDINWMLSPRQGYWTAWSFGKPYFRVLGDVDESAKTLSAEVVAESEAYARSTTSITPTPGMVFGLGGVTSASQVDDFPVVGGATVAATSHRGGALFVSRDDTGVGQFVKNFVGELGKLKPVHAEAFGPSSGSYAGYQFGVDPRNGGERKAMVYMPGYNAMSNVADGKVWLMEDQISIGIAVAKGTVSTHFGSSLTGYWSVRCWAGPGTTSAYPVTDPYYDGTDSNRPDIEITVYLPKRQSQFPNIREGDLVHYCWMPLNGGNRYALCLHPAYDDPIGTIKMWNSGSGIPAGWQICDGTNGTVDLRQKFIRGRDPSEGSPPTGAATHSHTDHSTATLNYQAGATGQTIVTTANHSTESNIPPYVTVTFIQRVD
jgi:hypothetical protein